MTPTERTLAYLRDQGYSAEVVENWVTLPGKPGFRKDLGGCIDILAVKANLPGVLGVQTTSGSNVSARLKKARSKPWLKTWLQAGNRFHVHGWAKRGKRGERKRWTVRVEQVEAA